MTRSTQGKQIVVCLGAGGVGKTTVSAALGILGACQGKKTLLITIDPAKRLANALGLSELGAVPEAIEIDEAALVPFKMRAPLHAMMLDTEHAWKDLVLRLSKDQQAAQKILDNRFYRYLSQEMAGSREFVACEALYAFALEHAYDLIVLDTPPAVNALGFLDAPNRILSFLNQEAFLYFIKQGDGLKTKLNHRLFAGLKSLTKKFIGRFVSIRFLEELINFLGVFSDLYAPLIKRTAAFQALLKSDKTVFSIVLTPAKNVAAEALALHHALLERQLSLGDFIVNRNLPRVEQALTSEQNKALLREIKGQAVQGVYPNRLLESILRAIDDHKMRCDQERNSIHEFYDYCVKNKCSTIALPLLLKEVESIAALAQLFPWLAEER